jgi:hypothetical protein
MLCQAWDLTVIVAALLQDFDSQSLAKLAYGLAAVGYDDDALYSAITTSAAAVLDSMSPADVAMILWACGEQGHLCGRFMAGECLMDRLAKSAALPNKACSGQPLWRSRCSRWIL